MQKDIISRTIPPAAKTQRGYLSSIDVNQHHILYFNGATVILIPQDPTKPVLNIVHLTDVAAVKFSPDGRFVASIESKGTLIISQICPEKLFTAKQYDNFFANAKALDWSADGKRICAVGQGKTTFGRVGLVQTGTNAGQISGVIANLNTCSFRPERPYKLALGGDQMSLKFYQGPPYSFKQSDQSHKGFINQLKYSPKGTYILTGGADRKLTLHQGLKFERILQKQNAHNGGIFGLDWIDQQHFVTCSSDKLIKVWNIKMEEKFIIETGSAQDMKNPKKIELGLVAVRVFKDLIYAINLEGNILVYKNPLITHQHDLITTYSGARSKVIKMIPFSDNEVILLDSGGRLLIYCISSNKIKAINSSIEIKNIANGFLQEVQNSKQLFVLQQDGTIAIYKTQSSVYQFSFHKKLSKTTFSFISSFQASTIVAATINSVSLYDSNKEQPIKSVDINEDITFIQSNNTFILVGTLKGKIYVYSQTLTLICKVELATFKISTIKIIPMIAPSHESLVLAGDSCANMKLFKISQNGAQSVKDSMGGHTSLITSADCDEKWIYSFSMDGKVNLWNRQTLTRDKEMSDIVKGGIISGISLKDRLFIAGTDLLVKLIPKIY